MEKVIIVVRCSAPRYRDDNVPMGSKTILTLREPAEFKLYTSYDSSSSRIESEGDSIDEKIRNWKVGLPLSKNLTVTRDKWRARLASFLPCMKENNSNNQHENSANLERFFRLVRLLPCVKVPSNPEPPDQVNIPNNNGPPDAESSSSTANIESSKAKTSKGLPKFKFPKSLKKKKIKQEPVKFRNKSTSTSPRIKSPRVSVKADDEPASVSSNVESAPVKVKAPSSVVKEEPLSEGKHRKSPRASVKVKHVPVDVKKEEPLLDESYHRESPRSSVKAKTVVVKKEPLDEEFNHQDSPRTSIKTKPLAVAIKQEPIDETYYHDSPRASTKAHPLVVKEETRAPVSPPAKVETSAKLKKESARNSKVKSPKLEPLLPAVKQESSPASFKEEPRASIKKEPASPPTKEETLAKLKKESARAFKVKSPKLEPLLPAVKRESLPAGFKVKSEPRVSKEEKLTLLAEAKEEKITPSSSVIKPPSPETKSKIISKKKSPPATLAPVKIPSTSFSSQRTSVNSSEVDLPAAAGFEVTTTSDVIQESPDAYPSTSMSASVVVSSSMNMASSRQTTDAIPPPPAPPVTKKQQSNKKRNYHCTARCSRSSGQEDKKSTRNKCQRQRITIEFCRQGRQPARRSNDKNIQRPTIPDELQMNKNNSNLQDNKISYFCDKSRETARRFRERYDNITTAAFKIINLQNFWNNNDNDGASTSRKSPCKRCCGENNKNSKPQVIDLPATTTKRDKIIFKFIQSICECDDNPLRIDDSKPTICGCSSEISDDKIQ